jgi:hypothetical protein
MKKYWYLLLLCVVVPALFGGGKKEMTNEITVNGRVRLVGNEPHTELVISDDAGTDYYIEKDDRALLAPYEQQRVTVRGRVSVQDLTLANGVSIGRRQTLHAIRLIPAPQ